MNWTLPDESKGESFTWEHAQMAVLMDIRDELRDIASLARCGRIPRALDAVARIDKRLAKKVKLP